MAATQHGLADRHQVGDGKVAIADKLGIENKYREQSIDNLELPPRWIRNSLPRARRLRSKPVGISDVALEFSGSEATKKGYTYHCFRMVQADTPG